MIESIVANLKNETDKESNLSKKIANVLIAKKHNGYITDAIKTHLVESGLTLSNLASAILIELPASLSSGINSAIYNNKNKSAKYVAALIIQRTIEYFDDKEEIEIYRAIVEKEVV